VTDPKHDPKEPLAVQWLPYWDRYQDVAAKKAYVADGVAKLIAEGLPPVFAAVTAPLVEQTDLAMAAIRAQAPVVFLRLHADATPHENDTYGRPMPPGKAGVVMSCKLGTNGAPAHASGSESNAWTGPARIVNNRVGSRTQNNRTVEIGRQPVGLPADDAATVLRQWGYGVRAEQHKRDGKDAKGNPRLRDRWLIVECDARGRMIHPSATQPDAPAATPAKTRAA
jgi:hypothetical protein